MKNILKSTIAVAAAALFSLSSFAKDNNPVAIQPLTPAKVTAISCGYQYSVTGNVGSPFNPSTFGNVYVTLGSGSASQGSSAGAQLIFTEHANAAVAANSGAQLRILTGVDICTVTASDWAGATSASGAVGEDVWYTYEDQVATPIPGVVMLVSNDGGATVWAFTLDSATAVEITPFPGLTIQGTVTINVNQL
ncbi:hypothetical protein [Sphingobacterium gobiense]|uniref:Uncharacterized protein n=1 Tax=Sphingobacterium gobiense TaxID=1382456 RepID=A0A2S9JR96_9SPHI|nr:hypothetical protein [Sphingobacterium gobiense]PRD55812.1 hypothetical protein C5749_00500 [Sphingobacterium gobiense]